MVSSMAPSTATSPDVRRVREESVINEPRRRAGTERTEAGTVEYMNRLAAHPTGALARPLHQVAQASIQPST